jgi:hypothetical protein
MRMKHAIIIFSLAAAVHAADTPFQLKPGEFPPQGSAHELAGELISIDNIDRTGILRVDRTDAQRRGDWDQPLPFTLTPFATITYHGAPAEIRHVPFNTHLHGWFFTGQGLPPEAFRVRDLRPSSEAAFGLSAHLEDDFSFAQRTGRMWHVDAIDLQAGKLSTKIVGPNVDPKAKPPVYDIGPYTRVWKASGFGALADIATGSDVIINITFATLRGPGRVTDIWLDKTARDLATNRQLELHRQFLRDHGLAAWIESVDNKEGLVSFVLFDGFDRTVLDEGFKVDDSISACVAEDNLRTWDQNNDRKSGPITRIDKQPAPANLIGDSGVRITFRPQHMLEGFRPKRIIRIFPARWKVEELPREEKMYQ